MKERYIRELVKLTKVSSEKVINATIEHMVKGISQKQGSEKYSVKQPDISRLKKRLIGLDEHIPVLYKLRNKKEKYLRELVSLTRMTSDSLIDATIEHMVSGLTQNEAAKKHGVNQPDISDTMSRFTELDELITNLNKLRK